MTGSTHTIDEPFFHREDTEKVMRKLAEDEKIVLFVGAGLSADQGLPSWAQLIEGLIRDSSMRIPGGSNAVQQDFVRYLTNRDLLSGGSLAKAVLGDDLLDHTWRLLYFDEERRAQRPATGGIFAAAVAEFAVTRMNEDGTCGVTVVTTNYDSLLEEAFSTSPDLEALVDAQSIRVVPVYDDSYVPQPFDLPVYHIHGFVPRNGARSRDIILSERDYGTDLNVAWATALVESLQDATWLILGASIQDPSLNRYLSRAVEADASTAGSPGSKKGSVATKRFAAVAMQSQPWSHEDENLRRALLWADARRLATLGVEPIHADFFVQIPQLLKEVVLAREKGTDKYFPARSSIRYGQRLMRWWRQIRRTRLADSTGEKYARSQAQLNELMLAVRRKLEDELSLGPDGERLKAELWVRNPETRSLELRGSSEYISTERQHLPTRRLDPSSTFASVQAFCYGSIQHVSIPADHSRWEHFVGIPVTLTGSWHQLPVGTLTIASTHDKQNSLLYRAEGRNLSHVYATVCQWAAGYLQPPNT